MITIERVTPKISKTSGKPYVEIEANGQRYSSKDTNWIHHVGKQVDDAYIVRNGKWLNLPDVKTCFGIPPTPLPVAASNGISAQRSAIERAEIIDRKLDAILAILKAHFK